MSSLIDSSKLPRSNVQTTFKGIIRPIALKIQWNLNLFPKEICLISGAPRSGTTALFEWLKCQQEVSAFSESRILVSVHKFIEEVHRFQNLNRDDTLMANMARHIVYSYYSSSRILIGKRMVVDKEPLEPIAFPLKEYGQFILNVRNLFPESKFLLAIRHPIATIWSMSQRTWGSSLMEKETRRFALEEYIQNWCSCADLILKYRADPYTYIIQFGRLIKDPVNESRRILNFLNISKGNSFQPHQTNDIGFNDEEREKILSMVQSRLESLNAQGISDLS